MFTSGFRPCLKNSFLLNQHLHSARKAIKSSSFILARANPDHQSRVKAIAPLSKWKIERCSTLQPEYCQKELVDYWLYRNNIHVVERLPKIDPAILVRKKHFFCCFSWEEGKFLLIKVYSVRVAGFPCGYSGSKSRTDRSWFNTIMHVSEAETLKETLKFGIKQVEKGKVFNTKRWRGWRFER